MKTSDRVMAVRMFLSGRSMRDVAAFYCVTIGTMEKVLRQAITGLAELKAPNAPSGVETTAVTVLEETDAMIAHDGTVTKTHIVYPDGAR